MTGKILLSTTLVVSVGVLLSCGGGGKGKPVTPAPGPGDTPPAPTPGVGDAPAPTPGPGPGPAVVEDKVSVDHDPETFIPPISGVGVGQTVSFSTAAIDQDLDDIAVSVSSMPESATFDPIT